MIKLNEEWAIQRDNSNDFIFIHIPCLPYNSIAEVRNRIGYSAANSCSNCSKVLKSDMLKKACFIVGIPWVERTNDPAR